MNGHVTKKGARYYVVLEMAPDPVTGKRRRKWHSGYDRKKDANDALHELVTDVHKGTYVEPTKETFGEFLKRWLPSIKETVRANTWEGYRSAVEIHLIPKLGEIPLRQLDRQTFSSFYSELSRTGRKDGQGLSPRSVRAVHVASHKALQDAVKDGLLIRNPTEDAALPAERKRSVTPSWTAEQVSQFLESVRGQRLHPAFHVLAMTGLRRSELLGLRWADVDLEGGSLAVRQVVSLNRYTPFLAEPKTDRSRRVVALDPGTVAVLKARRKAQKEERIAAGPAWEETGLVFAQPNGAIMNPQALSGAFERAAESAGLPPIGIHGLRHSHASLGLAAGLPLVIMSERLGHSSVALTGDIYSHSLPSQHQAAAEQVASLIGGHR